jgi:glycosyltransferase involved in cell wall biosynthesis
MRPILLSICIPTYNRASKVVDLVNTILKYSGDDIEVVVLDNKSTDDTIHQLKNIKDGRLLVKCNTSNIGSMPNIIKSLTLGNGKFLILCLDKDYINFNYLGEFINRLKYHSRLSVGKINLSSSTIENDIKFDKGFKTLYTCGYLSEHPSGLFVNREKLFSGKILDLILNDYSNFPFNPDLIKAELLLRGDYIIVNLPLISLESYDDCKNEVSHTYVNDNIYFSPLSIRERVRVFMNQIYEFNIDELSKRNLIRLIFSRYLLESTIEFRNNLNNDVVCSHHNISVRNISTIELLKISFRFNLFFLSVIKKIDIIFFVNNIIWTNFKLLIKFLTFYFVSNRKFK